MFRNATRAAPLNSRILLSHVRTIPTRRTFTYTRAPYTQTSATPSTSATKPQLNDFRRPIAKFFLGAMLTYQLIYWTWLKLETDEITADKQAELSRLETEVSRLTAKKDA